MTAFAIGSNDPDVNIQALADVLETKGKCLNSKPKTLRIPKMHNAGIQQFSIAFCCSSIVLRLSDFGIRNSNFNGNTVNEDLFFQK